MNNRDIQLDWKAFKKGDEQAFNRIYKAYYHKLFAFLLSYSKDTALVEDVIQDVFLGLWNNRENFKVKTSINSYIYRSAYNKLMDKFRKTKSHLELMSSYYYTALIKAIEVDSEYEKERLIKLDVCINKLPNRSKEIFCSSKIAGYLNKEVANKFEISLKTVEGHITKSFKFIKECLNKK